MNVLSHPVELNIKEIVNKLLESPHKVFSDVATQSLGFHQTGQRIVGRPGHVTCSKEVTCHMSHDQTDPQSSAQSDKDPAIGSQRH